MGHVGLDDLPPGPGLHLGGRRTAERKRRDEQQE